MPSGIGQLKSEGVVERLVKEIKEEVWSKRKRIVLVGAHPVIAYSPMRLALTRLGSLAKALKNNSLSLNIEVQTKSPISGAFCNCVLFS